MVVEKKSGDFKTVEIRLPSWMYSKVALAVMVAVIIIGFVYMTPGINTAVFGTNAKTSQDASPEVETPAENAAVDAATGAVVIESSPLLARWGPLFSVDNIPAEIKLPSSENLYITNFKIGNNIGGYLENRGTKIESVTPEITFVDANGYSAGIFKIYFIDEVNNGNLNWEIKPGQKKRLGISSEDAKVVRPQAKYFKIES